MSVVTQFGSSYLSASVFTSRAYRAIGRLSPRDVRLRKGGSKILIEEIWPIAILLRHLETPARGIRCRYVGQTEAFDARLAIRGQEVDTGIMMPTYFVEVTTAASPVDYLRREALDRNGGSFGGESIQRVGSKRKGDDRVVSHLVVDDPKAVVGKTEGWVRDAIKRKGEKTYPNPSILLINACPERPLALSQWVEIAENARRDAEATPFCSVFAVEPGRNVLVPISVSGNMVAVVMATHAY